MYILYVENPLKPNHFSTNPLFLLTDGEIHVIPPIHTEENQQNTKTVNRQILYFPIIFLLIDMFLW